jgi:uncharacterized membrane protein
MTTITFDTRKAVQRLKAAGIEDAQADAMVDTVVEAFGESVATRADAARLEARIDSGIANLKADMLKVAIGIVLANATLTFAFIRLFVP